MGVSEDCSNVRCCFRGKGQGLDRHTSASASMKVLEYRIVMPLTLEEYQRGHLYSVCKSSRLETGAGEGFEFLANEPYEDHRGRGTFTHKIIHLHSRLPRWVTLLLPSDALTFEEKCWNQFPYVRTEYSCAYFGEKLQFYVESIHLADNGSTENVHNIDGRLLQKRKVDFIDIAHDLKKKSYESRIEKLGPDPAEFGSEVANRGPLAPDWIEHTQPVMCAYKLAVVDVDIFGFQKRVEKLVQKQALRTEFYKAHRKLFCWMDEWYPMSMQQVREYEASTKRALHRMVRGFEEPQIPAAAEDCGFGGTGAAGFGGSIGDDFSKGFSGALLAESEQIQLEPCELGGLAEHFAGAGPEETALDSADVRRAPPKGMVLEDWWSAQLHRCNTMHKQQSLMHVQMQLALTTCSERDDRIKEAQVEACAARRKLSEARAQITEMREKLSAALHN